VIFSVIGSGLSRPSVARYLRQMARYLFDKSIQWIMVTHGDGVRRHNNRDSRSKRFAKVKLASSDNNSMHAKPDLRVEFETMITVPAR